MKKIIALLGFCILFSSLYAQRLYESESSLRLLNQAKEFYAERNYAGTIDKLNLFLKGSIDDNSLEEANFLFAASAYYMGNEEALSMMRDYLDEHADGRHTNEVYFFLGSLFFEQKEYKKAKLWLEQTNVDLLSKQQQDEYCFRIAYSYLEEQKYNEATHYFTLLERNSDSYRTTAHYYLAYIQYAEGNYAKALAGFNKLKENAAFRKNALYFTTQIYYVDGKYSLAIDEGRELLESYPNDGGNTEIKRVIGNAYYREGDTNNAIVYLSQYAAESSTPMRNDLYILGVCYYTKQDYRKAVDCFSKTVGKDDEIAQNAYLYLGQSYLKLGDKTNARMAFEAASKSEFDRSVQEAALYNYGVLIHETFSAFGENVRVFEDFLNRFPNSQYADQVSKYLVEVYMTTNNYSEALASIEKIKSPGAKILAAKQSILYQLGINAYTNSNFDNAATLFTHAIEVGDYNAEDKANALFWRAESYAKSDRYDLAQRDYRACLASKGKTDGITRLAYYGLGYAHFKQKNYHEALQQFNAYIGSEKKDNALLSDAHNRKGDCLFYSRDFSGARQAYAKAEQLLPSNGDYALYQMGIIEGLSKNYAGKIKHLNELIDNYPESAYADEALFEKGRTYVITEKAAEAEAEFVRLMDRYPNSILARKAGIQLGLLYFNGNRLDEAIGVLKNIQKNYPGTEEAKTALQDLRTIYIEKNEIDSYVSYTNSLGGSSRVEEREQDSLSYIAAEKLYMRGDHDAALKSFQNYLNRFKPAIFAEPAYFYSGKIFYNNNDFDTAREHFARVLQSENRTFREEALTLKADIEYQKKDYYNAMQSFEELYAETDQSSLKEKALLGLLRAAHYAESHDKAVETADKMAAIERLSSEMRTEAAYIKAKSLIALNKTAEAVSALTELKKDTRNAFGAEARYLLAQYLFDSGKKEQAEKEVLAYIEEGTPQAYWLARSFVLLSDIYIGNGDEFQARQYLESLKTNYKKHDDILPAVEQRLNKLNNEQE